MFYCVSIVLFIYIYILFIIIINNILIIFLANKCTFATSLYERLLQLHSNLGSPRRERTPFKKGKYQ